MTRLHCVCGALIEGSEEELLEAVERHLAEAHSAALAGSPAGPAEPIHRPVLDPMEGSEG